MVSKFLTNHSWKSAESMVRDHLETNAPFQFQLTKAGGCFEQDIGRIYFVFYSILTHFNHEPSLTLTKWSLCLNLTRP